MLSAHEFATLMLVRDLADHIVEREELDTLLERQLVAMEQLMGGAVPPRVTQKGDSLLRSLARVHRPAIDGETASTRCVVNAAHGNPTDAFSEIEPASKVKRDSTHWRRSVSRVAPL